MGLLKSLVLFLSVWLVLMLAGCNSNEITQNVEVNIEQSESGPQETAANDAVNPLLIIGGLLAIAVVGYLTMLGISFRFGVRFSDVVKLVITLAIMAVAIGLFLQVYLESI